MQNFDHDQEQRIGAVEETPEEREERAFIMGGRKLYRAVSVSAGVMVAIAKLDESEGAAQASALVHTLRLLVDPESARDLDEALMGNPFEYTDDESGEVIRVEPTRPDMETLQKVVEWLVTSASGRPLGQPSSSAGRSGSPASGMPPRGGSLGTVERRSPATS